MSGAFQINNYTVTWYKVYSIRMYMCVVFCRINVYYTLIITLYKACIPYTLYTAANKLGLMCDSSHMGLQLIWSTLNKHLVHCQSSPWRTIWLNLKMKVGNFFHLPLVFAMLSELRTPPPPAPKQCHTWETLQRLSKYILNSHHYHLHLTNAVYIYIYILSWCEHITSTPNTL